MKKLVISLLIVVLMVIPVIGCPAPETEGVVWEYEVGDYVELVEDLGEIEDGTILLIVEHSFSIEVLGTAVLGPSYRAGLQNGTELEWEKEQFELITRLSEPW